MDWLSDLTPAQREAVCHFEGPLLILAGAGSGKTRVITYRVAHLLREHGVSPYEILAITFTNKAAGEMRQRIEKLVPNSRVWISTFHSFGARLIRQYADRLSLDRNFTIYDVDDRKKLIKAALESANIDSVRITPERIEHAISRAKNQLLTPPKYAAAAKDFFEQAVAQVYPLYEKKLRAANALDFDDLLLIPALALKQNQELRTELDSRFRFVLIDEYQDTNSAQYVIARHLSMDYPNICCVGDPDQSIYGWRGANIRNILDFERDFPDATVILLERNYRSTQTILNAASQVIAHNKNRKPKRLITDNPLGDPVHILTFANGLDEADGVVRRIKESVEAKKRNYRDVAIFLRINALSRSLESAFIKHQVPYQIVRGLAFFERKENKDILAYLRLMLNPRDDISFMRVVNEPARGIGKVSLEHLRTYAEPREMSLLSACDHLVKIPAIKGKAASGLAEFAKLIRELAGIVEQAPDKVIQEVIDRSGYRKMLASSNDEEELERLANVEELITAARQFASTDPNLTISDFVENVALASDQDAWNETQDSVSVMTLHAAKGLEFPVVYMLAVEEGLLPHERSRFNEAELEEERRLAFVGMTRAMQELSLCHARERDFRGRRMYAMPSTFLGELPEEGIEHIDLSVSSYGSAAHDEWRSGNSASQSGWEDAGIRPRIETAAALPAAPSGPGPAYAVGMMVRHDNYGVGQITAVIGTGAMRKLKIDFSSHGEKTFVAEKAKLTVLQTE
jgi:DNA helicase II / ATP-dependent DNA helicase PcrA